MSKVHTNLEKTRPSWHEKWSEAQVVFAQVAVMNPSDADGNVAEAHELGADNAPETWCGKLNQFEANVVATIQRVLLPPSYIIQLLVSFFCWLFAEEQIVALGCVLAAARQSPDLVISVGRAFTITQAWVCYVPKLLCARPRPFWLENRVKFAYPWNLSVHDGSFPSGSAAFVATIAATCWNFGASRITSVIATCIAIVSIIANVVAGVHYPSDVITGAASAAALNYLAFGPLGLLQRSRGPEGFLVRDDELVNRQLGVTAAVTAVNAVGLGIAFAFAKKGGSQMTDLFAWTKTYQTTVSKSDSYQKHVDTAGIKKNVQIIDGRKKMESTVTPLLAASLTLFWTTGLIREIYVANSWQPYDRAPKHAAAAIFMSIASILLFVATRWFTLLVAVLLFFNFVVVEVIIFKLYENNKLNDKVNNENNEVYLNDDVNEIDMVKCITGFRRLAFVYNNFDMYPTYFNEESTMTLAQAGTYEGPEDIEEYVRYATASSPYVLSKLDLELLTTFTSFDAETGICQFVTVQHSDYTMNPKVALATRLSLVSMNKAYYDVRNHYLPRVDVFYPLDFVNYIFGKVLNTRQTREFICGVMADNCTFTRNMDDCVADLDALPTFASSLLHIDGNCEACRDLHGVFARNNPENHCPHISFEPTADPKGRFKCQESSNILPTDLFDDGDFALFNSFCEDVGIDPDQGYKTNAAYEPMVRVSYPSATGLPRTTDEAVTLDWIEVSSSVSCETRYRMAGVLTPTLIYDARGALFGIEMVFNTSTYTEKILESLGDDLAVAIRVRFRDPSTACSRGAITDPVDVDGLWVDAPAGSYEVSLDEVRVGDSSVWGPPSGLYGIPSGMGTHYWDISRPPVSVSNCLDDDHLAQVDA
ncbi:hypothetical protein CTAYLR_008452 [Chrysophaeum taylorii]|uniref:Phosphatidic acid phosphatase type 2/haloperoxidase domain-containing protein n=1 Tax=Chrysophaeum taylorii TaxID=2483200 RepID=A0AAD7UB94_9STRA|nr:hypothetical protein CTAYLR_008452 [Chrysophaeum taylorii]